VIRETNDIIFKVNLKISTFGIEQSFVKSFLYKFKTTKRYIIRSYIFRW